MDWSAELTGKRFRFVVLVILILIFITVATRKIWELRIVAERVGVLHTISNLQSALGLKMSEVVIEGGMPALATLDHSNPMRLWIPPPANYLGEYPTRNAPVEEGEWYFDTDLHMLIYRVRFADHFTSDNPQYPGVLRYQLRMHYEDKNGNGLFDPGTEAITGLNIEPLDTYHWLTESD